MAKRRKTQLDKTEEVLAEYENSHAKYEDWTINGQGTQQRVECNCGTCQKARELLDEDDLLDEPAPTPEQRGDAATLR